MSDIADDAAMKEPVEYPPSRVLFVSRYGLPTSNDEIQDVFSEYGTIEKVTKTRKFCFIVCADVATAQAAVNGAHGKNVLNSEKGLIVAFSNKESDELGGRRRRKAPHRELREPREPREPRKPREPREDNDGGDASNFQRIMSMAEEREVCRYNKDFAKADSIRDALLGEGVEVKDREFRWYKNGSEMGGNIARATDIMDR